MGRDEAPPFARGETYYNGGIINPLSSLGLGGINLEGKEYVFEPNSQDQASGYPASTDPNGRPIKVKVVRNLSPGNLKGARLAHYDQTVGRKYETAIDGYTLGIGDRVAGVIDEFLPPAGVPPNDLFYIIIDGTTQVTASGDVAEVAFNIGDRLVSYAATTTNRLDATAGLVTHQSLTGASATLAESIFNCLGFSGDTVGQTAARTSATQFEGVVDITW